MSKNFQFLGFEATPTEKHRGIATVRVLGEVVIVLRYKIVQKKDGSGCFPTAAAYKMPNRSAEDEYDDCFVIDSRTDNDNMRKFIMHHVAPMLAQQAHSAFQQSATPPQYYNAPAALAPQQQQQQQAQPMQYQQQPPQQQFFQEPPF